MVNLTREAIEARAAESLGKAHGILSNSEFSTCIKHVAARDYECVMTVLKARLDRETQSFAAEVMALDDLQLASFLFRRRVRNARKRHKAVSEACDAWAIFMRRLNSNSWD